MPIEIEQEIAVYEYAIEALRRIHGFSEREAIDYIESCGRRVHEADHV